MFLQTSDSVYYSICVKLIIKIQYNLSLQEYLSLDGLYVRIFLTNGKRKRLLTPVEPFDRLIYAAPVNLYVAWNCKATKMQVCLTSCVFYFSLILEQSFHDIMLM